MASRKISDLNSLLLPLAKNHVLTCAKHDITLLIYCTLRSNEEQTALFAIGRTKPGRKVTWAEAGESAHNFGLAYDCVPTIGGKPIWNVKTPEEVALWNLVGRLGEDVGLEWAGRWPSKKREFAHFQYPNWKSIAFPDASVSIR